MRSFPTIRKLLVVAALAAAPLASKAGIFISVGFAPPALPVYTQPLCPGDGYLWTPGYWAYDDGGYYWVPGVWVQPPTVGYLWTPPYWGFANGLYGFHEGYWGPHVGFYGGVNYGFGFFGSGYYGGRWEGNRFAYNRAVSNINIVNVRNVYEDRTVINNIHVNNRVSYNGGPNGIQYRPNQQEANFDRERHIGPTSDQQNHFQQAHGIPANFARNNGGNPQVAAMPRPGATQQAVPARGFAGQRADNQQQRIANGVNSGQINAREAGRIENREANINQTIRQDRQANAGPLTPQQRETINQRQDNTSRSIYQDNHNAATQPTARGGFGNYQPNNQAAPVQPQPRPDYQNRQQTDRSGFGNNQQQNQSAPMPPQNQARPDYQNRQQTDRNGFGGYQQRPQPAPAQPQIQQPTQQPMMQRAPQSQMQRSPQAQPRMEAPRSEGPRPQAARPEGHEGGGPRGGGEHRPN